MAEYRVGTGFDAHALVEGVPLVLGGVRVPFGKGLADIGAMFPSGDERWHGSSSLDLLSIAWASVRDLGWELANADCVLIGEEPRLAPHRLAMRNALGGALDVDPALVAVRATTTDGLGFTGRGEGLAAQAVALLRR